MIPLISVVLGAFTGCGGGGGGGKKNHPPVLTKIEDRSLPEDFGVRAIELQAVDADGDFLTYTLSETNRSAVEAEINGTRLTLRSVENAYGESEVKVTVRDGHGGSDTQSFGVKVTPVNDAPVAKDLKVAVESNGTVDIVLQADDIEGDLLNYTIIDQPQHGRLEGTAPHLTYTADSDYGGIDTFTYKANDGKNDSNSATVSVSVNQPPTVDAGLDRSVLVDHNITLHGKGSDPDGNITAYEWKEGNTVLATTANLNYTPHDIGLHTLIFSVTDNLGATSSDSVDINATPRQLPLLIIRVQFNDYRFQSDAQIWHNKIFGTDNGELNNYYQEISYKKFQFIPVHESEGDVDDGIVTVTFDYDHPNPGRNYFEDTDQAVIKADAYVDFSQYDKNGDGNISKDEMQIMLLIAGGESATGASPGIWAHQWCLYGGNDTPPNVDGVDVMSCAGNGNYSRFGEKHFDADNGKDATIGVIAHELGHAIFGLPDLYDTDGTSNGIGYFGLMGGGSWGYRNAEAPGQTPVHMTGWSKMISGFVTAEEITDVVDLELRGTAFEDFKLYKIPTNQDKEYFLLENRAAEGYDRGLYILHDAGEDDYQGGLLILHIDDNLWPACRNRGNCNADETHKLVDVVEANSPGLDDRTHNGRYVNLYYAGNNDAFTPNSDPNSTQYNGADSGINITNISERLDTMLADVKKDEGASK